MSLSYESSGVNYDQLDAFKRACQKAARTTAPLLASHGYTEPASTRGESAYLIEAADHYLAHVEEGLGTKNLVADAVLKSTGKCFYREVAIDTVATIVNDLATCGALPISIAMHAAVGDSAWFANETRMNALVEGWAEGCRLAGGVWGGGETPTLRGIVNPDTIVLAGSAIGKISPKKLRITGDVRDGDSIIFLASSGVQTNGLTLCRQIADRLPQGYETPIGHGDTRTYGEALLAPSVIYVAFVRECQRRGIKLNYVAHVTGHGWRKLMRLDEPFVYEIINPGVEPALFKFLREAGPIDLREAYATFNQGIGFAAYVAPEDAAAALAAAKASGYDAWLAGRVRKEGHRKAVLIPSLELEYDGSTLQVR
ncbi:phosphoribosylformylglycinamidine cyclo-ligase [Opitutaceae bacterium TAV4]|uniref:AIR synthase-related protein n=1 Tax=Geminisphaera colitermitum TaxID=1148786 RepID=UPI0001964F94|nr:AIR synthase-related protein [Geminisphaera colitermitum]RRJ95905.1 phosphoribosylformylglycinamidine cyclo-ligase [Opitutaceae bacterium TAV4]RRK00058.1 phosphoribosylformylglycinamidine cyclo-ligase [Opitutaceae bacterium TAV3]